MSFFLVIYAFVLLPDSLFADQSVGPEKFRLPQVIDELQFSPDDDQQNEQLIYKWFERNFFSAVQGATCTHDDDGLKCVDIKGTFDEDAWRNLTERVWQLVDHAFKIPALALGVAMSLYSWFWWEGPVSTKVNVAMAHTAYTLLYHSLDFGRCRDPHLPLQDFFVKSCHVRWRYLMMIVTELGRHLAADLRDIVMSAVVFRQSQDFFTEMKTLPAFGPHAGSLSFPHDVSFNRDYFPASVVQKGPVWRQPHDDLPIVSFLEDNVDIFRSELLNILQDEERFPLLNRATRSAEPQFGPRDDDWTTAYLIRNAQFNELICAHAPQSCELLRSRPEIAECHSGVSGSGFLRVRPGGRLKAHFGNSPRLSVHLALIVPDGEIYMSVGRETVRWEEGKVLVFDDTFIHSVTHNGDKPRYVLNVWMCHPCDPTNGWSETSPKQIPRFCEGPEEGVLPPDTYRRR